MPVTPEEIEFCASVFEQRPARIGYGWYVSAPASFRAVQHCQGLAAAVSLFGLEVLEHPDVSLLVAFHRSVKSGNPVKDADFHAVMDELVALVRQNLGEPKWNRWDYCATLWHRPRRLAELIRGT